MPSPPWDLRGTTVTDLFPSRRMPGRVGRRPPAVSCTAAALRSSHRESQTGTARLQDSRPVREAGGGALMLGGGEAHYTLHSTQFTLQGENNGERKGLTTLLV